MTKLIKFLITLFVMSTVMNNSMNGQNPLWTLPGSFIEFDGPQLPVPLPIPDPIPNYYYGDDLYGGGTATNTHNAMVDANDVLMFFVIDGYVFNKEVI